MTPLTDVDSASCTVPPSGGENDSIIRAYLDLETALVEGLSELPPEASGAPLAAVDTLDLEPVLGEPVVEPGAAVVPEEEAPDFTAVAPEGPEALDLIIDADLETALVEGLSELPPEASGAPLAAVDTLDLEPVLGEPVVEPGAAVVPEEEAPDFTAVAPEGPEALDLIIDADLETALVEGLSELPPEASGAPLAAVDTLDLEPVLGEPVVEPGAAVVPEEEAPDFTAVAPEGPEALDLIIDADLETALVEGLSELPPEASGAPLAAVDTLDLEPVLGEPVVEPGAAVVPEEEAPDFTAVAPEGPEALDLIIDADLETALVEGLSELPPEASGAPLAAVDTLDLEPVLGEPVVEPGAAVVPEEEAPDFTAVAPEGPEALDLIIDADLETALVEGLSELPPEASGAPLAAVDTLDLEPVLGEPVVEPGAAVVPEEEAPDFTAVAPEGPEAQMSALAFAADLETEAVLREALFEYRSSSPDHEEPQVWPGGLRAAIDALAGGYSAPLLVVDLDGIPYPAGALYKLAAVCEMGTTVVAIGSDATAKASRQILLAGVSDYLTKPITVQMASEAIAHATTTVTGPARFGRAAAFIGVGGSGATTLAVASALQVAKRGRYVSILDLNRTISQVSLMLDLEPAPGLDHLLDAADPDIVDATQTHHSERIAVFAYRSGPVTASGTGETVGRLAPRSVEAAIAPCAHRRN